MSGDHDIPLLEFVYSLRAEVERHYVHPACARIIHEWLTLMFRAAAEGDAHEVKRLTKMVQRKVRDERLWHIKKLLTFSKHHPASISGCMSSWECANADGS